MKLPIRALLKLLAPAVKALAPLLLKLLPRLAPLLGRLGPYGKTIAPLITGLLGAVLSAVASGTITATSLGSLALGIASAIAVYFTPNAKPATKAPSK